MDKAIGGDAVWLVAGHTLASLWPPVSTDIVEAGNRMEDEHSRQNDDPITGIVLGGKS